MVVGDSTTCYSIESAWFQRLKLECDELLSSFAFNFNLRRYGEAAAAGDVQSVGVLLHNGIPPDHETADCRTALIIAAKVRRCRLTPA